MGTKSGSVLKFNEQMLSDDLVENHRTLLQGSTITAKATYYCLEDRQGGRGAVLVISRGRGQQALCIKEEDRGPRA